MERILTKVMIFFVLLRATLGDEKPCKTEYDDYIEYKTANEAHILNDTNHHFHACNLAKFYFSCLFEMDPEYNKHRCDILRESENTVEYFMWVECSNCHNLIVSPKSRATG